MGLLLPLAITSRNGPCLWGTWGGSLSRPKASDALRFCGREVVDWADASVGSRTRGEEKPCTHRIADASWSQQAVIANVCQGHCLYGHCFAMLTKGMFGLQILCG